MTIKDGEGWVINGYLSIVHVIQLDKLEEMLLATEKIFYKTAKDEKGKEVFRYQLQRAYDRMETIKGIVRNKRSIDWIGSAWKWIAGNPDATDWNKILESQQEIIENNEQQYIVNKEVIGTTNDLVKKMNNFINRFNNKISQTESGEILHAALSQIVAIKEDIDEVVRACQLAKAGIINTNLLNMEEIHQIVSEVESLPYNNEIEAIEYGKPSIFSNGTSLLYIISIPKVDAKRYNKILLRAAVSLNRQIDLKFNTVLLNHEDIYGIKNHCSTLNNVTICSLEQLERIQNDDCLSRMLRGIIANCTFRTNKETTIELLEDDLIYVTNFKGNISSDANAVSINGTYLIRFFNETIMIGGRNFTNKRITGLQALPPLLTNVYEETRKVDANFLHELNERNIKHIKSLTRHVNLSLGSSAIIAMCIFAIAILLIIIWKKIFGRISMPAVSLRGIVDQRDADT